MFIRSFNKNANRDNENNGEIAIFPLLVHPVSFCHGQPCHQFDLLLILGISFVSTMMILPFVAVVWFLEFKQDLVERDTASLTVPKVMMEITRFDHI